MSRNAVSSRLFLSSDFPRRPNRHQATSQQYRYFRRLARTVLQVFTTGEGRQGVPRWMSECLRKFKTETRVPGRNKCEPDRNRPEAPNFVTSGGCAAIPEDPHRADLFPFCLLARCSDSGRREFCDLTLAAGNFVTSSRGPPSH